MKKVWIGGAAVVVVSVGVLILTSRSTNNAKRGINLTTETARQAKMEDSSVNSESSGAADGEKDSVNNLSAPVRELLGLDEMARNYNSLERAIGQLSKDLGSDDVAALRDFLMWPNERFPEGMRPIEINAVKNDVLDRLLRQNTLPEGIGLQLVDMASNLGNDPVWRDYCIQFMTPYYERASEEFETTEYAENTESGKSVDELKLVREAMLSALDEPTATIAGTALIGAELLSRTHEEFDRDTILAKQSKIAADESVSTASRLTALRMSSVTVGDETTADTARLLAQTADTVYMRSAAIVTLGETGSEADRELLESYVQAEDRQIAGAAKLALQKMDARGL